MTYLLNPISARIDLQKAGKCENFKSVRTQISLKEGRRSLIRRIKLKFKFPKTFTAISLSSIAVYLGTVNSVLTID